MDEEFEMLLDLAKKHVNRIELNKYVTYGGVACALITDKGNVYTGIYVNALCCIGFCAEQAAIAEMMKNGETKISKLVSVTKGKIYPPCGKCREFIRMINPDNLNTKIILEDKKVITIGELLPYPW